MAAGRPILSVPPNLERIDAKQVLVAWKDTREARRAVWDSLPLLRRAESVVVATMGDEADRGSAADVSAYLSAHGVKGALAVVLEPNYGSTEEAEPLMMFAQAEGAGLIVAGAYGHNRVREWLFGGVTRNLLRHAPMPCLLTH